MKDFIAINFSESVKEEQNLRKVAKSLYFFLTTPDEVQSNSSDNCIHHYNIEILNLFDPKLQLINTKPVIKNKLKELLSELKKFKVHAVLVLDYKKRNDRKIFHPSTKLISSDSDIDEAFKSMHQSIMTKINKGQCTTGPTVTTVQSSKQLIKKFWHTVQSIALKKSNFGPNLTF